MFIICLVWGFTFVAGKAGVSEIPPMMFTALRYLLLSLILFPFLKIVQGNMPQILIISMTMGSAHFALFYGGMSAAENVSSVAVATQLGVPISTVMSIVFLQEQVRWRRWLGVITAFGGVMVISFDPAVVNERLGLLLVVGAAFIGSAGTIIMKQVQKTGVYQMQAWISMLSWPPLIAVSLIFEGDHVAVLSNASWMAWGGVVYTAIGASLIGHAGMYYLLQRYDVSVTAPLTLMAPIFGIVFGVLVWGDSLGLRFWMGSALTLFGVLIIGLRKREVAPAGNVL
ncbi:DMT family transporter [Alphaproteobacteria bacterium]|nr:DMT family transporter [Alphaproteobacteria bacterium]